MVAPIPAFCAEGIAPPDAGGGGGYVGPLDIVGGAVVAYGQRALSSAKRGSALYTIRRDSDDTTQSFSSDATSGAAPVAAISSFVGAGNGFASLWNDQSGNSNDIVQSITLNRQPQWSAAIIAGVPGFIGTPTTLSFAMGNPTAALTGDGMTIFVVTEYDPANGPNLFSVHNNVTGFNVTGTQFFNVEGDVELALFDDAGTRAVWATTGTVGSGNHLLEFVWAADGTVTILNNGTDLGATLNQGDTVQTPIAETQLFFGVEVEQNQASQEFLAYSVPLSDADRLAIRQNIAAYYGITLS